MLSQCAAYLKNSFAEFINGYSQTIAVVKSLHQTTKDVDSEYHTRMWRITIAASFCSIAPAAFLAQFIDWLFRLIRENPANAKLALAAYIVVTLGYNMLRNILASPAKDREKEFEERLREHYADAIAEKTLTLSLNQLVNPEIEEMRAGIDEYRPWKIFSIWTASILFAAFIIASTFALVAALCVSVKTTIVLIVVCIVVQYVEETARTAIRTAFKEKKNAAARRERVYARGLFDTAMFLQIYLYGAAQYIRKQQLDARSLRKAIDTQWDFWAGVWQWCMWAVQLISLYFITIQLLAWFDKGTSHQQIFLYLGAMKSFFNACGGLSMKVDHLSKETKEFAQILKYLAIDTHTNEHEAYAGIFTNIPDIRIADVSFIYPSAEKCALTDVSVTIRAGEIVALVGNNGSGKTTLAKLIAKFYTAKEGCIFVGDTPLTRITQASWLGALTFSTADNIVPSFPIREIISSVDLYDLDWKRLSIAAEMTGLTDIMHELPKKLETIVNDPKEGRKFSSGQLQRIKIAAGVYHALAPQRKIVILDEPMANCDHATRATFYGSLAALQKTVIIIAHDPLYLNNFTRVIELTDGSVTNDLNTKESIEEYRKNILATIPH